MPFNCHAIRCMVTNAKNNIDHYHDLINKQHIEIQKLQAECEHEVIDQEGMCIYCDKKHILVPYGKGGTTTLEYREQGGIDEF